MTDATTGSEAGQAVSPERQTATYLKRIERIRDGGEPFAPPYMQLAADKKSFEYIWGHLHIAFDLPNPALVSPLELHLSRDDLRMFRRYVSCARELASYPALNHSSGYSISQGHPGEPVSITSAFPSRHEQQAFAIQLRQLHGTDKASYQQVHGRLIQLAKEATDPASEERFEMLKKWGKARSSLMKQSLSSRIQEIASAVGAEAPTLPDFHSGSAWPSPPPRRPSSSFFMETEFTGERSETPTRS